MNWDCKKLRHERLDPDGVTLSLPMDILFPAFGLKSSDLRSRSCLDKRTKGSFTYTTAPLRLKLSSSSADFFEASPPASLQRFRVQKQ
jgi:hypothetical protein